MIRHAALGILLLLLGGAVYELYLYNFIPHRKYASEKFGIPPYSSSVDQDGDGVDDQTDILNNAKDYLAGKPKYKSQYYTTGYPDDEYGVCTDVVAFAMLGAGYNLMELVQQDIAEHPEEYDIGKPDANIDFRRVKNLIVYFRHTAIALTTDPRQIEAWQGGDIVIWNGHIGIISDHRNKDGIPFVLHNARPVQASYEEDILESYGEIVGHYRISE